MQKVVVIYSTLVECSKQITKIIPHKNYTRLSQIILCILLWWYWFNLYLHKTKWPAVKLFSTLVSLNCASVNLFMAIMVMVTRYYNILKNSVGCQRASWSVAQLSCHAVDPGLTLESPIIMLFYIFYFIENFLSFTPIRFVHLIPWPVPSHN